MNFGKFLSKISTIHGLSYIGDGKSSKFAKIFWISAIISSFLGCFFYFLQVYDKIFVSPDISIKISYKQLNEFPFPAITICPHNKFPHTDIKYKEKLMKLKRSENLTQDDLNLMEVAFQCCQLGVYDLEDVSLNISNLNLYKSFYSHQYFIDQMVPISCFESCSENPRVFFDRILTFQGFCATFNLIDSNNIFTDEIHENFKTRGIKPELGWTLSNGYSNKDSEYPQRLSSGYYRSFNAILLQDRNKVDSDCFSFRRGYEIYWHLPNEILTPWHSSININNINKDNQIYLRAKSFKMEQEMKSYDVKYRECYFEDEKRLKFYKIYTENNCKFECLTNYTLETCGCVRYFMPRNDTTKVCTSMDIKCTTTAEIDFEDNSDGNQCGCYPPCNNIQYELFHYAEINLLPDMNFGENFDFREIRNPDLGIELKKLDRTKTTSFSVKSVKGKVEERTSFSSYKMQHFISDFGGLLGLAMGCSILSIVEIIYNAFNLKNEAEIEEESESREDKGEKGDKSESGRP